MLKKNINENNICLILTATINTNNVKHIKRSNYLDRLNDYKLAFKKILNNYKINNIIFIENSGFDLSIFHEYKKKYPKKKIEILSVNNNKNLVTKYGKGYGEYLSLKEVILKSRTINKYNYFLKSTGRYYISNFNRLYYEMLSRNSDVYVIIKKNLKFIDSGIFGGSLNFLKNYLLKEIKKSNDDLGLYFEKNLAVATFKAINDNLNLHHGSIYPRIEGISGTTGLKFNNSILKDFLRYFIGKIKKKLIESITL